MKIDPAFWKTGLLSAIDQIQQLATFNRYGKRRADELEREIMLAVFCVRTLIDRQKLSQKLVAKNISVTAFPKKTQKPVTWLNTHDISELYHLGKSETKQINPWFLCNQVIHSYTLIPVRDGEHFTHILVCSDHERNKFLYLVSIEQIIELLRDVASDSPDHTCIAYNPRWQDYDIRNFANEQGATLDVEETAPPSQ